MSTRNFWTAVGIILAILGIFLALYYGKEKKREPVYSVIKTPSLIFDRFNASPTIKLIVNDSITLSENVYITTLVIWNKGKLPINKEDIRQDLFIYCSDSTSKILDYNIIEEKESGVSNFKLTPKEEGLQIGWEYFDPGFGFKFQVIYTGNDTTKIVVSGNVLGSKIKKVFTIPQEKRADFNLAILLSFIWLIFPLTFIWSNYNETKGDINKFIAYEVITIILLLFFILIFLKFRGKIFAIGIPF